jgi:colanic acid/amylovoran biosynthesis glycosyltransferase
MTPDSQNIKSRSLTSAMTLDAEPDVESTPGVTLDAPKTAALDPVCRLVYLLSRYPAVSHTFFLNEILELRKLGFLVEVASINQPDRPQSSMPAVEANEADNTFYIKSTGIALAAWITVKTLLTRPRVFARGLTAAFHLCRWDLKATIYALFYFVEALILGDWMRLRNHRHLHIHFCGPVATVGMLASVAWGFPYSLTVHGPDEFYDVKEFYLRQKAENAKFILCISDFCRSQLMRLVAPKHWEKMHVVRLGVDPDLFFPVRQTPDSADPLEIICVGRLVESKGQLILLRACSLLTAQGYAVRLRLVGAGPDRKHLEEFAAEKNMPVIFEGARNHDETRQLLGHADVFVLSSFAEGLPVALMEAMAMEVPCVSTYIAGIPELVRDGLDGLLVPASSVETLAMALRRLHEDPLLRRSLGTAGRKRVLEFYNLSRNVSSLARVWIENLPNTI